MEFSGKIVNPFNISASETFYDETTGETEVWNVRFTYGPVYTTTMPHLDFDIGGNWTCLSSVLYDESSQTNSGLKLDITKTFGKVFVGEMEQITGTTVSMKDIKGVVTDSYFKDGNECTFGDIVDETGQYWSFIYVNGSLSLFGLLQSASDGSQDKVIVAKNVYTRSGEDTQQKSEFSLKDTIWISDNVSS